MGNDITTSHGLTIGLDLGDKYTEGCVLSESGEVVETFRVATTMTAMSRTMAGFEASRVVLEVGTHSPWVSRLVERAGHEVIIANPRRVRLIAENDAKTDEVDAELLARLGRVDPGLSCAPTLWKGVQAAFWLDVRVWALNEAADAAEEVAPAPPGAETASQDSASRSARRDFLPPSS